MKSGKSLIAAFVAFGLLIFVRTYLDIQKFYAKSLANIEGNQSLISKKELLLDEIRKAVAADDPAWIALIHNKINTAYNDGSLTAYDMDELTQHLKKLLAERK